MLKQILRYIVTLILLELKIIKKQLLESQTFGQTFLFNILPYTVFFKYFITINYRM